jgi:hypothetical protein
MIPIKNNKSYYAVSNEVFKDFRVHMKHLLNDINFFSNRISGICHQMLFQTHVLQNLIDRVEKYHLDMRGSYMPFWKIMLIISEVYKIYYSEYDIYFNFILSFHRNTTKITNSISWDISSKIPNNSDYTYITAHSILRNSNLVKKNSYYIDLKGLGINDSCINDSDSPKQVQTLFKPSLLQSSVVNRNFKMRM